MQAGLSTQNAPAPYVVLPHYAFGAIAFLVAGVMLFLASGDLTTHYFSAKLLALTHMLVLGWITMVIFGALYQLIPVVMEVKLFSERLAFITFIMFGAGLILLSLSFWSFNFQAGSGLQSGGGLLLVAVVLFSINAHKSASQSERKTIENRFIVTSVGYLFLTALLGFLLILNYSMPFIPRTHIEMIKLHAHLGMIGWFLFLVIGVASKLMPMFLIVHKLPVKLLNYAFYLINAGLVLLGLAFYFFPEKLVILFSSLLIVAGIVLFLRFNYLAFKKRIRRKLDIGMRLSAMAFIMLSVSLLIGLMTAIAPEFLASLGPRLDIVYGVTIILGFFSSLVLGQTYKTLPFIIWLKKYQSRVGKEKTPLPVDLYSERVAKAHFWTYLAGIILLVTGILAGSTIIIKGAALLIIITGILYNYNVFKIIFHKVKQA